jgi:mitogen-activated protein kinase kinase kinase
VHRDIKGANVLVDLNFCVRLADFGCSKRDDMTASYTTVGSIPWMAPEVIQREGGHGRKADICQSSDRGR